MKQTWKRLCNWKRKSSRGSEGATTEAAKKKSWKKIVTAAAADDETATAAVNSVANFSKSKNKIKLV